MKSAVPLNAKKNSSKYSITETLAKKESEDHTLFSESGTEDLLNHHFSGKDLEDEWNKFLENLKKKDVVIYSAVNGFRLEKTDENTITVHYPSESAKSEFDKIQAEFFSHFKRKVNHFQLSAEYKMDLTLKKEIITKRMLFEKMAQLNPLLKDLDDLMKFDFS